MRRHALAVVAFAAAASLAAAAGAAPLGTTREDFRLPGTQPMTITQPIATPEQCTPCHAGYGQPAVEPFRAWRGSMMAQAGRDPLMWAALAVSNQDAPHSGETCLRCHLGKGWLEGRSAPEDGTAMTADDRQGVQCGLCHRLVDPVAHAGEPGRGHGHPGRSRRAGAGARQRHDGRRSERPPAWTVRPDRSISAAIRTCRRARRWCHRSTRARRSAAPATTCATRPSRATT